MVTVCQCNSSIIPRLKDGGTKVSFLAGGRGIVSAGPTLEQAKTRVVEGAFGSPAVTLEIASPRKEPLASVHASAHVASGCPPSPDVKFQIEASTDGGGTWKPVVRDWTIPRRGDEPKDFWSQSLCYGSAEVAGGASSVRVRFSNSGNRPYLRGEVHGVYRAAGRDATKVTFDWIDDAGPRRESRVFPASAQESSWDLKTGKNVLTRWVEYEPAR
jgi:hypothetical protein